jgi:predicted transcriptional regulator
MSEMQDTPDTVALTVQLLSAYLANNTVAADTLADLIRTTKAALSEPVELNEAVAEAEVFTPVVSVRKSLASAGHIISLIDGRPYKVLKRHLASQGLTPETYRSRYNLPADYPMVAPEYSVQRRE